MSTTRAINEEQFETESFFRILLRCFWVTVYTHKMNFYFMFPLLAVIKITPAIIKNPGQGVITGVTGDRFIAGSTDSTDTVANLSLVSFTPDSRKSLVLIHLPLSLRHSCVGGCGEGLGESQFRRLEKKLSTLPTLW
jgi:hypothetical protein